MAVVGVVMGSASDWPVMEKAADVLAEFSVPYAVKVSSAHRTLDETVAWARQFAEQGGMIIIAGAGLAAHLPGVVAAAVELPVIGVPIASGHLNGVDALYSIVQMPPGVPVAAVGINGARNAGLLAVEILALASTELRDKLCEFRRNQAEKVAAQDAALRGRGGQGERLN
ncbi:MAG: 5-(carboxyamino)imidazole ribonucleotide mutase [Firmicutes bacterium]|nr:5-(carboxyamino)imidazole ribonucleotide mutase [Bacillota bacterium]